MDKSTKKHLMNLYESASELLDSREKKPDGRYYDEDVDHILQPALDILEYHGITNLDDLELKIWMSKI